MTTTYEHIKTCMQYASLVVRYVLPMALGP